MLRPRGITSQGASSTSLRFFFLYGLLNKISDLYLHNNDNDNKNDDDNIVNVLKALYN